MPNNNFTITYNEPMSLIENHNAQLVFHWLCRFRNSKNGLCCPSFETLSKNSRLSRSSIIRSIKYLINKSFIKIEKKTGRSNKYIINKSIAKNYVDTSVKITSVKKTPTSATLTLLKYKCDTVTKVINNTNNTSSYLPPPKNKNLETQINKNVDEAFFSFYNEILDEYNKILSHKLRTVDIIPTVARVEAIRRCKKVFYNLEKWRKLFSQISKTSFLCGAGKKGFKADFDWIIEEKHFINILEGKYESNYDKASILEEELTNMLNSKNNNGYEIDPEIKTMEDPHKLFLML